MNTLEFPGWRANVVKIYLMLWLITILIKIKTKIMCMHILKSSTLTTHTSKCYYEIWVCRVQYVCVLSIWHANLLFDYTPGDCQKIQTEEIIRFTLHFFLHSTEEMDNRSSSSGDSGGRFDLNNFIWENHFDRLTRIHWFEMSNWMCTSAQAVCLYTRVHKYPVRSFTLFIFLREMKRKSVITLSVCHRIWKGAQRWWVAAKLNRFFLCCCCNCAVCLR